MKNASKYSFIAIPLLCFAFPVAAQKAPSGPPPVDRRMNTDRIRQQEMSSREWQLRNFGNEAKASKDRRQIEALLTQTEEDFNRILTLHNEIARLLSASKPIEYNFISDAGAEIKKRATRLQSTLALRQLPTETPVVEKTDELNDPQMKDALIRMCKQIRSFVTNPVIANPSTVDAQQLSNARRDLESLIQLSGHLKKEAGKKHATTALNVN
ncbi:MAG TPA: hypothetical protein VGW58_13510 [Pyrinomonadaceae bacterium]|nr:hypothetical protein [Pyrinomonadaceae bacterium]